MERSAEERTKYPDRINLDRRGLHGIPLLADEPGLRLLRFPIFLSSFLVKDKAKGKDRDVSVFVFVFVKTNTKTKTGTKTGTKTETKTKTDKGSMGSLAH